MDPPIPRAAHPTAPPNWKKAALRETTLCLLSEEDAQNLRKAGEVLHRSASCQAHAGSAESPPRVELRAVVADLLYLQGFLVSIYQAAEHTEVEPADHFLTAFAGRMAPVVQILADVIATPLAWPIHPVTDR